MKQIITIIFIASFCYGGNSREEAMLNLFDEAYYKLKASYVDSINSEEVIKSGIKGMLMPLDPYTKLLVGSSKDRLEMLTKGKYGGVGISIGFRKDTLTVPVSYTHLTLPTILLV